MVRTQKIVVALISLVVCLFLPKIALAQTASALVLEQSGASTPAVASYSEIPAGTTVSLQSGAKLVFLHYNTCRQVAIVGGMIRFSENDYVITGGKKEAETRTPCPRPVVLKSGGEMAGVMLRSAVNNVMVKFSERPAFVLIGKRADDFASLRIVQADKTVLEAPLEDRHFSWPKDAAPLAAATGYEMVLTPKAAGTAPAKFRFIVEKPADASAEGVVLINAE